MAWNVQRGLDAVKSAIAIAACGKPVRLVAVSKFHPAEAIMECYSLGNRHFGENYIQELEDKANALQSSCPEIRWHYIGQIQSNKIGKIACVPNLYCVETLETEKHANLLENAMEKQCKTLRVLVQVNTSAEVQKGGVFPAEAVSLAQFISTSCPHLTFSGFMTIGSMENSGKAPNPDFDILTETRKMFADKQGVLDDSLELSMGMSSDMEQAIKQGSTSVRVGTAIFGTRDSK